jgi:arylsulfatase A-like enzyme
MKPNVLFLVIDSLREDRFSGDSRSCKTPNIDSLLKNGVYFNNTISSSDVTGICLGNIFSGMYSFKTGLTLRNFNHNVITLFDILKNYGYELYATIPNLTWFNLLIKNFNDYDHFKCANRTQDSLFDHVGETIIERLSSSRMKEPWIYYIHLEDLHDEIIVPEMFNDKKFGETKYDKTVSSIDYWIGKILMHVNLEKTLVIITSDHGETIPIIDEKLGSIPNIQSAMKKGKEKFPILEPVGLKLFILIRDINKFFQKRNLRKKFSSDELRTLAPRGAKTLFEETQHVPLLFVGSRIKESMILKNLVSGVDILKTILSIIGIKHIDPNLDGRNLQLLFNGKAIEENPIFIESGDTQERKTGYLIGVRTTNYKYLRSRKNINNNVSLFDIQNDPMEKNNVANENPAIIEKLEKVLSQFILSDKNNNDSTLSNYDDKKISEELKKLGYI